MAVDLIKWGVLWLEICRKRMQHSENIRPMNLPIGSGMTSMPKEACRSQEGKST